MKHFMMIFSSVFILFFTSGVIADDEEAKLDLALQSKGNVTFALDLYKNFPAQDANKNLIFSPYSISSALAMTSVGARGLTGAEMGVTLSFWLPGERLHRAFSAINTQLAQSKEGVTLSQANAIWKQDGFPFLQAFLDTTGKYYGASVFSADFENALEKSRVAINGWVETKTNQLIKNLIAQDQLPSTTKMVLVNAIHFKGQWKYTFDTGQTREMNFYSLNNAAQKTPFMIHGGDGIELETQFGYAKDEHARVLSLPYKGDEYCMLIAMPSESTIRDSSDLNAFKKGLTVERLAKLIRGMWLRTFDTIALPKFKIEAKFELSEQLKQMGMHLAFENNADFSGLSPKKGVKISKVIHKAVIEVDEQGSEAAAATAVVIIRESAMMDSDFIANSPFVFAIYHKSTGSVVFMGQVVNLK